MIPFFYVIKIKFDEKGIIRYDKETIQGGKNMEEKLEKVKEILTKQNQEQLLKYPMIQEKEELLDSILDINFDQLNTLYQKAIQKEEKVNTQIKPISYIEKASLPEQEKEIYKKRGEQLIKEGKYAVVTMAGGQRNKARS